MALFRKSEPAGPPATQALRDTVSSLPTNPNNWTPEQRARHHKQSNAAAREQAGVTDTE